MAATLVCEFVYANSRNVKQFNRVLCFLIFSAAAQNAQQIDRTRFYASAVVMFFFLSLFDVYIRKTVCFIRLNKYYFRLYVMIAALVLKGQSRKLRVCMCLCMCIY